jgi:hypothetical protein
MQIKPNFLIIGAPKAGTTSLWAYLRQHPEIFMTDQKELNYFSRDDVYLKGWPWYMEMFHRYKGELAVGEASPSYCMIISYPKVIRRIAENLPDAKLIYIVRDPFERVRSAWLQFLYTGHAISGNFIQDIKEYGPMIEQSLYWQCISAYKSYFLDENILILFFEDLQTDAAQVVRHCYKFLGVDTMFKPENVNIRYNTSAGRRKERKIMPRLRRARLYSIASKLPEFIKTPIYYRLGQKKMPEKPAWDPEVKDWYYKKISADVYRFLDYVGMPRDFWF